MSAPYPRLLLFAPWLSFGSLGARPKLESYMTNLNSLNAPRTLDEQRRDFARFTAAAIWR
jgi:hypothetical protein